MTNRSRWKGCMDAVAVLPCAHRKQADALVRFARLTDEARAEAVARRLCELILRIDGEWGTMAIERQIDIGWHDYKDDARAILVLLGYLGGAKKVSAAEADA